MGNAANKQQGINNKNAGTLFGESQGLVPGLESGWQSVMAPLSPTDTAAIQQAGEGATAQSYDSSANQVASRAAASNNPVGALDTQDALARQKATAVGGQALTDQATIDQMNLQRKEAGLGGLSGLEQNLQGGSTNLYGSATQAGDTAAQTDFNWGNFLSSLVGGGAAVGAAALKK